MSPHKAMVMLSFDRSDVRVWSDGCKNDDWGFETTYGGL
jgi:hypothetical protein